jgi:hypothetical protein
MVWMWDKVRDGVFSMRVSSVLIAEAARAQYSPRLLRKPYAVLLTASLLTIRSGRYPSCPHSSISVYWLVGELTKQSRFARPTVL